MANLKQWGYILWLYAEDNDTKFPEGSGGSGDWPRVLRPYYVERGALTLCPTATKPYTHGGRVPFGAWSWGLGGWDGFEHKETKDYGSYGLNEFLNNPQRQDSRYWRSREVKQADTVPLFFDCVWFDVWPSHTQGPPEYDGLVQLPNEMHLVCINRHKECINGVFMDFAARKIRLKELWTLRWHRTFDIHGPWTQPGGVGPDDWPEWMRGLKDY